MLRVGTVQRLRTDRSQASPRVPDDHGAIIAKPMIGGF